MRDFEFYNPTTTFFGNGVIDQIGEKLNGIYKSCLLVSAKGPFRESGLYDRVKTQLEKAGMEVFGMSDIDSNPKMYSVYEGVKVARDNGVECIVALGGGSAMDCSKIIAMSAKTGLDPYEYVWGSRPGVIGSLDTVMIPTIAATGTELNNTAVIVDADTKDKSWCLVEYPKYCFMDPVVTSTLPRKLTIWGAMDILSHSFEYYFNGCRDAEFQLCFSEALIKATMSALERLHADMGDLNARGEIMWISTMTWGTGLTKIGRGPSDHACHNIEERISGHFDTHHGGGMGVVTPRWMRVAMLRQPWIFARFARNIMGIDCDDDEKAAVLGVDAFIEWLKKMDAPQTLYDLSQTIDFSDSELDIVADKIWKICDGEHGNIGKLTVMSYEDIKNILYACREELTTPYKG